MAVTNVTATLSREELFGAFQEQVNPAFHDILRKEIDRRWPKGLKVQVHLILPPAEAAKSVR